MTSPYQYLFPNIKAIFSSPRALPGFLINRREPLLPSGFPPFQDLRISPFPPFDHDCKDPSPFGCRLCLLCRRRAPFCDFFSPLSSPSKVLTRKDCRFWAPIFSLFPLGPSPSLFLFHSQYETLAPSSFIQQGARFFSSDGTS